MNITTEQKGSAFSVPPLKRKKRKKYFRNDGKTKDTYN